MAYVFLVLEHVVVAVVVAAPVGVSAVLVDVSPVVPIVQEVAALLVSLAVVYAVQDALIIVRLVVAIHVIAHALGCVKIVVQIAVQDNKVAIFIFYHRYLKGEDKPKCTKSKVLAIAE